MINEDIKEPSLSRLRENGLLIYKQIKEDQKNYFDNILNNKQLSQLQQSKNHELQNQLNHEIEDPFNQPQQIKDNEFYDLNRSNGICKISNLEDFQKFVESKLLTPNINYSDFESNQQLRQQQQEQWIIEYYDKEEKKEDEVKNKQNTSQIQQQNKNIQYEKWEQGLVNFGNTCFFNSSIQMMMHCLDIIEWKNQKKSQTLEKLLELKRSKEPQLTQNLKNFYDSLSFGNKEKSFQIGNDPVRVISSIIQQSMTSNNYLEVDLNSIKKSEESYKYWASDNSDLSFLFKSVIMQGYWCPVCDKTDIENEQQNYCLCLKTVFFDLQTALEESSQQTLPKKTCECTGIKESINGFIKLPQFFYINLDVTQMGSLVNNEQLKLRDQLRNVDVIYDQVGFICHPTFHYTYIRKQNDELYAHFNDFSVRYSSSHNQLEYPIKGILYSCSINQDPTIIKHALNKMSW